MDIYNLLVEISSKLGFVNEHLVHMDKSINQLTDAVQVNQSNIDVLYQYFDFGVIALSMLVFTNIILIFRTVKKR